jgi:predicted HNH restriction endonuclease
MLDGETLKYWRMSFRWGNQGRELWPYCFKQGVAAIGYYIGDESIVTDCSKITEEEYDQIWREKGVYSPSAQGSLKKLAYNMKKDDVIYAKEGSYIVGKGRIKRRGYQYKPNVLNIEGILWEHYVEVDWENDFTKFKLDLGANQHTVLELNEKRLKLIRENETQTIMEIDNKEAEEGKKYTSEATFRKRNRSLIDAKKSSSDYRCEVCGMKFEEVYGKIGREYIIAHHKNPIGGRRGSSKTTMGEIALVCSNCHDMLHRKNPPMSIDELRNQLQIE